MRIAICDNDEKFLRELHGMILEFATEKDLEVRTEFFYSGEELLALAYNWKTYDIIFMDIYLTSEDSGMNGVETIRNMHLDKKTQVVFTTSSREHAIEAFNLGAAHYLLKPLSQQDVSEALERCLERSDQGLSRILEVKTRQGMVSIPAENIVFIEVCDKICQIHTVNNCIQTYSSLDSLSEQLDAAVFMRAQRSFIVNMKYIEAFQYDRVQLTIGKEIMLSRKTKAELKERYQKFLFDLARRGTL